MSFDELVLKNRSYRGFDESYQVSRDELLKMVACARITASSMNMQPLKYFLGTEPNQVRNVLSSVRFAAALTDRHLPEPGKHPTAFVLVCQDMEISQNMGFFETDVGIVAQTILLKATEMGLGGCMMSSFKKNVLKELLQLPETIEPLLLIPMGKPAEKIVLVDAAKGEPVKYYRDAEDTHYVPKRKMEDILL